VLVSTHDINSSAGPGANRPWLPSQLPLMLLHLLQLSIACP